ncbi:MAG: hypothetical protein ABIH00_10270 [Armatimonadota bacterium]
MGLKISNIANKRVKVIPLACNDYCVEKVDIASLKSEERKIIFNYFDNNPKDGILTQKEQYKLSELLLDNELTHVVNRDNGRIVLYRDKAKAVLSEVKKRIFTRKYLNVFISKLGSKNTSIREKTAVAEKISKLGIYAKPAIPVLINALKSNLGLLDKLLYKSSKSHKEAGLDLIKHICNALINIGRPAVPDLLKLLLSSNTTYSEYASSILMGIGEDASSSVPVLKRMLTDKKNLYLRINATKVLGSIGPKARICLPEIARNLEYSSGELRSASLLTLQDLVIEGDVKLIDSLLKAMNEEECVPWAVKVLVSIGEKSTYPLISKLDTKKPVTCGYVLAGLAELRRKAYLAEDAVKKLAKKGNHPYIRCKALNTLCRISGHKKTNVYLVAEALKDDNSYVREAASETLCNIGKYAEPALPFYDSILINKSEKKAVRLNIIISIGEIGKFPEETKKILLAIVDDPGEDENLKFNAFETLLKDKNGWEYVKMKVCAAKLRGEDVPGAICRDKFDAISELGYLFEKVKPTEEVVLALLDVIKEKKESPGMRAAAIGVVYKIGPYIKKFKDTGIIRDLERISKTNPDADLRRMAKRVLIKINSK